MRRGIALVILLMLLLGAFAAAGGEAIDIPWWSVDGGAGSSAGGDFEIAGAIGQPDAGQELQSSEFTIVGGIGGGLVDRVPVAEVVYLPLLIRD